MMQKIEKWRLEELSRVLKHLAELLENGDNREWANVFFHFHQESQGIITSRKFDIDQTIKLVMNIKNCYSGSSSFSNLVLYHEDEKEKISLNQDLLKTRARLQKILAAIEDRGVEYIS